MNDTTFPELGLDPAILKAIAEEGYEVPTPIQRASIPSLLAGKDLLGCAQTGTGKTAAFALPIIQLLAGRPGRPAPRTVRALIVAPTRELAAQIDESFGAYSRHLPLRRACIFGGVGKSPQEKALSRGVDVLTATPGRLLDLHGEGKLRIDTVEIVVLDEADRMLDMGFIHDVRKIVALLPKERQTLLFSATMPATIATLAHSILRNPVRVDISPEAPTVELIEQSLVYAEKNDKRHLLSALIKAAEVNRALVFTRTKHGADRLVKYLERDGIAAAAIHANKSQNNRIRTLENFRDGTIRILVATDLAARGIDVDGITHVFNYELPNEPETYVHRIGRTARAGADGIAIAFCDDEEKPLLRSIERLIGKKIPLAAGPHLDEAYKTAAVLRKADALLPPLPDRGPRPERGGRQGRRSAEGGRGPASDQGRGTPTAPKAGTEPRKGGRGGPGRADRPRHEDAKSRPGSDLPATKSSADPSRRGATPSRGQKPAASNRRPQGLGRPRVGDGPSSNHEDIRKAIRDIARGLDS